MDGSGSMREVAGGEDLGALLRDRLQNRVVGTQLITAEVVIA